MTINTRADLDSIAGTPAHAAFMAHLKGSLTRTTDVRTYPAGYDRALKPGDAGYLAPQMGEVEDTSVVERFGFTKADFA